MTQERDAMTTTREAREIVRRFYAKDEQGYDQYRVDDPRGAIQYENEQWIFRQLFRATEKDRVLEVGAGTGRFTIVAAATGAHIVATDINENMLSRLPARVPEAIREGRIETRTEDVFHLSYEDDTFDFAFGIHIIPRFLSLQDQREAIAEIVRVLKPGGHLLFNFSNRSSLYGLFFEKHAASWSEIDSILKEAGMVVVDRRAKWLLTRSALARVPVAVGKIAAWIDRRLVRFAPSLAFDVYVLAEKRRAKHPG